MNDNIRPIAIYLPQYHPIPENDKAWGDGFTEWTNVKKAKPLFEGHYQPHVPHEDIGYYDLRDPGVLIKQAAIAKEYGIYGFAFYHYWFNGKQLLETPLENMLKSGKPDFPFLYIWANENWTKRWDGLDNEIIIKQDYSLDDDLEHIKYLCEHVFSDERYIKIEGKPVFAIYRSELFPDIEATLKIWRSKAKDYGYNDLYLIRVESFIKNSNPIELGFDAAMEFSPNFNTSGASIQTNGSLRFYDYAKVISYQYLNTKRSYPRYRTVFPCWDNVARKKENGTVFINNILEAFQFSLKESIGYTREKFKDDQQYFFINAWNEWGEGCHIEPDKKHGYLYLETISDILQNKPIKNKDKYIDFLELDLKKLIECIQTEKDESEHLRHELFPLQQLINTRRHRLIENLHNIYKKLRNV